MTRAPESGRVAAGIDQDAIEANCRMLAERVQPGAELCAVVKANGYGHGAALSAGAALRGGATRLAVAAALEAEEIRLHFAEAPILVLGAMTGGELRTALAAGAEVGVWRESFRALCSRLAGEGAPPARVHVKHDSGMGRLGERDPDAVVELARACAEDPAIELAGIWTHLATADEDDTAFMAEQLASFSAVVERVREFEPGVTAHAANSAATLREPASHFDMVRCGIAVYGLDPFQRDAAGQGLAPALELRSYVSDVKRFEAGASAGYGRAWRAPIDTWVGVLPVGYGDGYSRAHSNNGDVLVRGRRHPVVGTVSMDNITIDLGPDTDVEPGDEAILIGAQGDERIWAEELAERTGTINYEITTAISRRVPRLAGR
ncbi:alanine racemase [soil metagenome]